MSLILDSSATLAWTFPEERMDAILYLFKQIADYGAVVPELWRIEVANVLNLGIRRGRISRPNRHGILADLENLPIFIDRQTRHHTWKETLELSDRHNLTLYDATYLELALRLSLPLATLDEDLRQAAQQEGVLLLGK
ncbi:MAG TPA: type II toxin-antitoxin system VapC family toxin [Terracidiphilus sp.]